MATVFECSDGAGAGVRLRRLGIAAKLNVRQSPPAASRARRGLFYLVDRPERLAALLFADAVLNDPSPLAAGAQSHPEAQELVIEKKGFGLARRQLHIAQFHGCTPNFGKHMGNKLLIADGRFRSPKTWGITEFRGLQGLMMLPKRN